MTSERAMKYRYTRIYLIKGIIPPPADGDIELLVDPTKGLRAILTSQPDTYSFEIDRRTAVAGLMLQGLGLEQSLADVKKRVAKEVEEIKKSRTIKFRNGPFLIMIGEGDVGYFKLSDEIDIGDFIYCIDGVRKNDIRAQFEREITAIITSIIFLVENVYAVRQVAEGVVFFRNNRPVYSYSIHFPPMIVCPVTTMSNDVLRAIPELYKFFATDESLQRVQRFIKYSLETGGDRLRSFIWAWTALEIFTENIFAKRFPKRTSALEKKFKRIAEKFAPATADEDSETFKKLYKIRKKLYHEAEFDEDTLPVDPIRNLVSKYFRLYIEKNLGVSEHEGEETI